MRITLLNYDPSPDVKALLQSVINKAEKRLKQAINLENYTYSSKAYISVDRKFKLQAFFPHSTNALIKVGRAITQAQKYGHNVILICLDKKRFPSILSLERVCKICEGRFTYYKPELLDNYAFCTCTTDSFIKIQPFTDTSNHIIYN
jgi:hypothetical protein